MQRWARTIASVAGASFIVMAGTGPAGAALIRFDFEGSQATSPPFDIGTLDGLSVSRSGITLDISRPGSRLDIINSGLFFFPDSFGTRSIDPFFDPERASFIQVNLSRPASAVSVDMGDFGQDSPDILRLEAYSGVNGTGSLLGADGPRVVSLPTDPNDEFKFDFKTLGIELGPDRANAQIRSLRLFGGSADFPTSVYMDNIIITDPTRPLDLPYPFDLITIPDPSDPEKDIVLNGLTVQTGGDAFDGFPDLNHLDNTGFWSLDFDFTDLASSPTTTIRAAMGGIITDFDATIDPNGTQPHVTIYHGNGYFTEYREFSTISSSLSEGDFVTAETPLGTLGPNVVSNDHLHFQIKYSDEWAKFERSNEIPDVRDSQGRRLSMKTNPGLGGPGVSLANFDFVNDFLITRTDRVASPLPAPLLPTDMTIRDDGTPVYNFDFSFVDSLQSFFIDPPVAIGYDYQVLSGPLFASVLLPDVGDGFYELWLFDDAIGDFTFGENLIAGLIHDFPVGGVDLFRILGIETAAGLDPNDPLAFPTGLTFVEEGEVRLTMTPISQQVPEPSGIGLLSIAMMLFVWLLHCRFAGRVRMQYGPMQLGPIRT